MTGRVYLDWNAGAPLRAEARAAMLAALDLGNPSSVHAEGRAARAAMERARAQVAALAGCDPEQVIFTASATEAAALAARNLPPLAAAPIEHDCVAAHAAHGLPVRADGAADVAAASDEAALALQVANSETGVVQPDPVRRVDLEDAAQAVGRTGWRWNGARTRFAILSSPKLGGPKGAGALIAPPGAELDPLLPGGGQERRRRAGTENVAAVAGFGAAAEAALAEREAGVWEAVAALRERLEDAISDWSGRAIIFGREAARLPNTLCVATPGWRGETQVMGLDLAGFAVSAGSACASGKTGPSAGLAALAAAMGFDAGLAGDAIRVSLGPTTTMDEIDRFARAWAGLHDKRRAKAA